MSDKPKINRRASDVTSRLTDASKYTGAHKSRFDADGQGLGKAGREEIVNYTGSTSSAKRNFEVKKTEIEKPKKPVVQGKLGDEKFGTQAEKPISFTLFRNHDKHHAGEKIILKKTFTGMDKLLAEATKVVKLPTGAVMKIYKPNCKSTIKSLEDLEDGGKYLCCSGEKPAPADKLPTAFLK
eukprot:Nk52_evm56s207 gene=Nk52_evmTU56s207